MATQRVDERLIEAPASDDDYVIETLGYIDDYDELDGDYAFLVYKQTQRDSGNWCVRIASLGTTGALFAPADIEPYARFAAVQGRPYFSWGMTTEPSADDPRHIEFRVHVAEGRPVEIEICLQMRRFNQSAGEPKSARFPWPARC